MDEEDEKKKKERCCCLYIVVDGYGGQSERNKRICPKSKGARANAKVFF